MLLLKVLLDKLGIRQLTDEEDDEYFDRLEYLQRLRYKEKPISADEIERETLALDDRLQKLTQSNTEFTNFEGHINSKYGIKYDQDRYPTFHDYVSSLFLVDLLEQSFRKGAIKLSNEITALDVGAGDWSYCVSLLRFLEKFEGERKVKLIGVDYDGKNYTCSIQKMTEGLPVTYITGNVVYVPKEQVFDLLFVAHMVYAKYHCKEHKVPYIGEKRLFGRFFELLKLNYF